MILFPLSLPLFSCQKFHFKMISFCSFLISPKLINILTLKRLLLILSLVFESSNAYDWASGSNGQVMWSLGCDFYGNDIGNVVGPGEQCGSSCACNPGCDHFTWHNGVCYMKEAVNPPVKDLNGAVCGWVTNRPVNCQGI